MKKLLFIAALFFSLTSLGVSAASRDPGSHFFQDTFGDYSEELERAREEGKKGILIFFEMDECPFCHFMKTNVLNQSEVQDYYREHFLLFILDIEGDVEITDFQGNVMAQKEFATKINRVRATPVIAFYDLEGRQIHRHTGRTSGVEEFLWMGEYVVEGAYKNMRFTKFKREKKKSNRK